METRFANSPNEVKQFGTEELRAQFLVQNLFENDCIKLVYSHFDRIIIGGVKPVDTTIVLSNEEELKADYFLQRREMGIINIGGAGIVHADGENFTLNKLDCIYLGKETKEVNFKSLDSKDPALFYLLSTPAHHKYPSTIMLKEKSAPLQLGDQSTSNKRTIYKYIHLDGIKSCQLVMGLTVLENGSVWNSVPPHTHTRRMEVYCYFDLSVEHRVFHFMGEPQETRHIVMANHEAVISPPWSMHYGCGTSNYGFIWGMAGENMEFTDMDPHPIPTLK
ncbi:5-dehydro-4-deoxy-D-glucuronate isomerase [Sediminibacterium sp.]|uniref:5-dehydro-4-deoxy-D-glucuronate isomerase n=1 Tax=Sediminibacterium sp. TaxID=1917865 RepID=UPI00273509D7|nr:5-dehydro-4-deoxy-D-glucuronate isomerase [Sediminibacterium sp.]MDP3394599.1 5-dehydro-4-deoxy-D-glucuronate isomerase [Sediminibacterium sp.]MDP3568434.1 5-dehydro-4-deoxy-D-glucuronate isomerase [Sediminibacterium sp.]